MGCGASAATGGLRSLPAANSAPSSSQHGGGSSGSRCRIKPIEQDTLATADAASSEGQSAEFEEILASLRGFLNELGGVRHFEALPRIEGKVKAKDFRRRYTDFEYVYLTVLGFAKLAVHSEELIAVNNRRLFMENPCVQTLERLTGMTMHADREGADNVLRSAPGVLLEAFAFSKADPAGARGFFFEAFDRNADPCLEGRLGRLMDYIHKRSEAFAPLVEGGPPLDDLALRPLPQGATAQAVVGEHLRVFVNECTWRWARARGVDYGTASAERSGGGGSIRPAQTQALEEDFAHLCNASTFEADLLGRASALSAGAIGATSAACATGTPGATGAAGAEGSAGASSVATCERAGGARRQELPGGEVARWEVQLDGGHFAPFDAEHSEALERASLSGAVVCEVRVKQWSYQMDLERLVQRNTETLRERKIRRIAMHGAAPRSPRQALGDGGGLGAFSMSELKAAIAYFVELHTLPEAPPPPSFNSGPLDAALSASNNPIVTPAVGGSPTPATVSPASPQELLRDAAASSCPPFPGHPAETRHSHSIGEEVDRSVSASEDLDDLDEGGGEGDRSLGGAASSGSGFACRKGLSVGAVGAAAVGATASPPRDFDMLVPSLPSATSAAPPLPGTLFFEGSDVE